MTDLDPLRFPIGKPEFAESGTSDAERRGWIDDIRAAPAAMREAVEGLSDEQLDTPYREGGWTVRQVVHHVPDSHANAYIRFRLALTEDEPQIVVYDQAAWAELPDASRGPVEPSLALLENLHLRWVSLLDEMDDGDFARAYRHPEDGLTRLEKALQIYAWHGKHHIAQITSLRKRMSWG